MSTNNTAKRKLTFETPPSSTKKIKYTGLDFRKNWRERKTIREKLASPKGFFGRTFLCNLGEYIFKESKRSPMAFIPPMSSNDPSLYTKEMFDYLDEWGIEPDEDIIEESINCLLVEFINKVGYSVHLVQPKNHDTVYISGWADGMNGEEDLGEMNNNND